jgi:hypothetical protein
VLDEILHLLDRAPVEHIQQVRDELVVQVHVWRRLHRRLCLLLRLLLRGCWQRLAHEQRIRGDQRSQLSDLSLELLRLPQQCGVRDSQPLDLVALPPPELAVRFSLPFPLAAQRSAQIRQIRTKSGQTNARIR